MSISICIYFEFYDMCRLLFMKLFKTDKYWLASVWRKKNLRTIILTPSCLSSFEVNDYYVPYVHIFVEKG